MPGQPLWTVDIRILVTHTALAVDVGAPGGLVEGARGNHGSGLVGWGHAWTDIDARRLLGRFRLEQGGLELVVGRPAGGFVVSCRDARGLGRPRRRLRRCVGSAGERRWPGNDRMRPGPAGRPRRPHRDRRKRAGPAHSRHDLSAGRARRHLSVHVGGVGVGGTPAGAAQAAAAAASRPSHPPAVMTRGLRALHPRLRLRTPRSPRAIPPRPRPARRMRPREPWRAPLPWPGRARTNPRR